MLAIVIASAFSVLVARDRKMLAGIIMLAAIIAIAITAALPVVHPAYGLGRILGSAANSQNLNDLSSNRIEIWIMTAERMMTHPWFGWGIDQYRLSWPEGTSGVRNPHQSILQLLFATGVAGAFALAMIVIPFARRIPVHYVEPWQWAAGAFLVSGTMYGLYDGFFYYAYPTMIYLLSATMLLTLPAAQAGSDRSS
jgi:O-antigen ligase